MKQNTILLAGLIVLAVALIGAGAWVYQNQIAPKPAPIIKSVPPDQFEKQKQAKDEAEVASWQTYRNEEYGFEMKYPENLYVGKECNDIVCFVGDEWSELSRVGRLHHSSISIEFINSELSPKTLINDKGTEVSMSEIDAYVLKWENDLGAEKEKKILECVNKTRDCQYFAVKDKQEAFIGIDKIPAVLFNNRLISGSRDNAMIQFDSGEILNIRRNNSGNYSEKNIPKEIYDRMLSTIKFIGVDVKKEIISKANFGQRLGYIEKTTLTGRKKSQHYPEHFQLYFYRLVLKQDNNEKVLDTSMGNNAGDVFIDHFASVKFSPGGNYLIARSHLWENKRDYIYSLASGEKLFDDNFLQMAGITEFTPDEKYFYSCGSAGIDGTNMFKIVSIPDMKLKYSENDKIPGTFYEEINCGYDQNRKVIYFNFIDSRQAPDKRIEFSIIAGEII